MCSPSAVFLLERERRPCKQGATQMKINIQRQRRSFGSGARNVYTKLGLKEQGETRAVCGTHCTPFHSHVATLRKLRYLPPLHDVAYPIDKAHAIHAFKRASGPPRKPSVKVGAIFIFYKLGARVL